MKQVGGGGGQPASSKWRGEAAVLKQNKKLCTYAQKKSLHICKVFGKKKVPPEVGFFFEKVNGLGVLGAVQMRTIIGGGNGGTNLGHLFQFAANQFSDAGALLSAQHIYQYTPIRTAALRRQKIDLRQTGISGLDSASVKGLCDQGAGCNQGAVNSYQKIKKDFVIIPVKGKGLCDQRVL
ncbi:hypothetical protein LXL04_022447 [Taraxacum kok-saghyz]